MLHPYNSAQHFLQIKIKYIDTSSKEIKSKQVTITVARTCIRGTTLYITGFAQKNIVRFYSRHWKHYTQHQQVLPQEKDWCLFSDKQLLMLKHMYLVVM